MRMVELDQTPACATIVSARDKRVEIVCRRRHRVDRKRLSDHMHPPAGAQQNIGHVLRLPRSKITPTTRQHPTMAAISSDRSGMRSRNAMLKKACLSV
jgi:hypothetical protein